MSDPRSLPAYHPLVQHVARGLRQRRRVPGQARLLVAVSGGADSVALLRALAVLAPRRGWNLSLIVGHVQHHLREEAEGDARFVAALAGRLGLPFARADLRLPDSGNLEAQARRQRYAALHRMASEHGAGFVATAHHGDDQLETLLMRLLRGASVSGLRGIAWHRHLRSQDDNLAPVMLVRPMLASDRREVMDFLKALDQPWREDHTNADVTRVRARLRRDVLPHLHELCPNVAARATRLSDHAGDIHRLVQREVCRQYQRLVREEVPSLVLDRNEARSLPRLVLTSVLRQLLHNAGTPLDRLNRRTIMPIARAVRDRAGGQRRFTVAGDVEVTVTRDCISIHRGC